MYVCIWKHLKCHFYVSMLCCICRYFENKKGFQIKCKSNQISHGNNVIKYPSTDYTIWTMGNRPQEPPLLLMNWPHAQSPVIHWTWIYYKIVITLRRLWLIHTAPKMTFINVINWGGNILNTNSDVLKIFDGMRATGEA